ncbi:cytidyltransferase-like protein [Sphingomonas oleivorans]|uniref:Cytidyltransferase-like protein n=1 Tax=Sphingomonas oleivorans TaxID=1735121 RepID=A0A2T5FYP1_9SPHN|nr:adenylyltransferase/cytidyltransferase family protein [Sphingomonas oleivorans]PTQ11626.1 cytidyltransferase-like protein [Sphingomonas oleivorans]
MDSVVVYVSGVFDLFHRGHVELLRRARKYGTHLVVGVNSDLITSRYKRKPFFSEDDRLAIVRSCKYVDLAFIATSLNLRNYIVEHGVKKIVHGDDWEHHSYLRQIGLDEAFIERREIEMIYLPYWNGISTSQIIERVARPTSDMREIRA